MTSFYQDKNMFKTNPHPKLNQTQSPKPTPNVNLTLTPTDLTLLTPILMKKGNVNDVMSVWQMRGSEILSSVRMHMARVIARV
jgi:hypothetical protein